jgi:hypothetical protein
MAAAASPEQRRIYDEMAELTRNRRRCAEIEERTRVVLPPDTNRWRTSAPPPASAPQAEPSPQRPSGWQSFTPLGKQPGIDTIDAMCAAQDRRDKAALIEAELAYRQHVIDEHWEVKLADEQRRRKQAEHSCHRGPNDSDANLR